MEQLIQTLEFDELIEKIESQENKRDDRAKYITKKPIKIPDMIEHLPCFKCPFYKNCDKTYDMCPEICKFLV